MKETAYLLQAVLIAIWWIGLAISDRFFAAFQFPSIPPAAFWAFLLPDAVVIAATSVFRAYRRSRVAELVILGGFAYATLYCVNASLLTRGGYLSSALMVAGLAYNGLLCFNSHAFRVSASRGIQANSIKTAIQIVCVWTLTLVVIPYVILNAFGEPFEPANRLTLTYGLVLFAGCSALGLWSAFAMVTQGRGTPLPLDQACRLVTVGPYRFVRNPMAVAGIGQGLAVSVVFWSLQLVVYSLLGAVVWHVVVRPIEERDLEARLGKPYVEYRKAVRCWLPRFGGQPTK